MYIYMWKYIALIWHLLCAYCVSASLIPLKIGYEMRYIATILFPFFSLAHPKIQFLTRREKSMGPFFQWLTDCLFMCICEHSANSPIGHPSMMWYRCICVWMCMNCGLNIVMNFFFCCWFIYYYDCDSMERPFQNWIERQRKRWRQKKKRVLRKFHQHCLFLLHILSSSSSPSSLLVVVQLLFHSNDFHFIKFHWNCSIFTFHFFLPFFSHYRYVCVSFALLTQ